MWERAGARGRDREGERGRTREREHENEYYMYIMCEHFYTYHNCKHVRIPRLGGDPPTLQSLDPEQGSAVCALPSECCPVKFNLYI